MKSIKVQGQDLSIEVFRAALKTVFHAIPKHKVAGIIREMSVVEAVGEEAFKNGTPDCRIRCDEILINNVAYQWNEAKKGWVGPNGDTWVVESDGMIRAQFTSNDKPTKDTLHPEGL